MCVVGIENVIAPLLIAFFLFFLSVCGIGCWRNLNSVGSGQSSFLQGTEGIVWENILVAGLSHMPGTCSRLSWAQLPLVLSLIFV